MSTQKAKFELFQRLQNLGFTYEEAVALRRIEMMLHRWAEAECGSGDDFVSWSIERDETTGKPRKVIYPHSGESYSYAVADRETGALKRLAAILYARNNRPCYSPHYGRAHSWTASPLGFYHQTDPRDCALYIGPVEEMNAQTYTRGLAVCA